MAKLALWKSASELHLRLDKSEHFPLEVPELKTFIPSGLERGCLVEIIGGKSSGRTSISLYILNESLSKGESCAYIDLFYQLDPVSVVRAESGLGQLSWVRCHGNTEHAIRAADLLLHAGGFGVVLLDLCGISLKVLNKIPQSYWFRFRRAVEDTPTILLICTEYPQARSCSRHSLEIKPSGFHWEGESPFAILKAIESNVTQRKAVKTKVTSIRPESLRIPTGDSCK